MSTQNQNTFEVFSTHGMLTADINTGDVINRDIYCVPGECDNCIDEITRVDVDEWKRAYPDEDLFEVGVMDVLDLGTWNTAGEYSGPEEDVRQEIKERNKSLCLPVL